MKKAVIVRTVRCAVADGQRIKYQILGYNSNNQQVFEIDCCPKDGQAWLASADPKTDLKRIKHAHDDFHEAAAGEAAAK